jgi:hypothetical protein
VPPCGFGVDTGRDRRVQGQQAIADYSGIRIDSCGRRFQLIGARVWSLPRGQAASFSDWHRL